MSRSIIPAARFLFLAMTLGVPVLALGPTGCGDAMNMEPTVNGKCSIGILSARTDLFFGTDRVGMAPINDSEWQSFVDNVITPRFPDGLSMYPVAGQYLQGMMVGLIKEKSYDVVLLHDGTDGPSQALEQIRATYKTQFKHEAVLRLDTAVCLSF